VRVRVSTHGPDRKTYEIFAAYWPYYEKGASHGGIATMFQEIKE